MTILGHVQDGIVVFDQPVTIANGTRVRVEVEASADSAHPEQTDKPKSLAERLANVIGTAKHLPPDASINVDHYLYGAPKRT